MHQKLSCYIHSNEMIAASQSRVATAPDAGVILAKATLRAAERLGLSQKELALILGASTASVSRVAAGARPIDPQAKEGELALLLVRLFRGLDALVGANAEAARAWLRAPNDHLSAAPVTLLQRVEGLVRVVSYLDAMRGKL